MAKKITFLKGSKPLVKIFEKRGSEVIKHSYPLVKAFTSFEEDCNSIQDLAVLLVHHARQSHCLLKGAIKHELAQESRAGATSATTPTYCLVIDADGLAVDSLRTFISLLPEKLRQTSHVVQWSASQGLGPGLRCHIFYWLAEAVHPETLKQWMTWLNMAVPEFKASITLSKTKMGLKWPLDITINQNDKLIYIAPPILKGDITPSIIKDFDPDNRVQLFRRRYQKLKYDFKADIPSKQSLGSRKGKILNALREKEGLKPHKPKMTTYESVRVASTSNEVEVTGIRHGDEFIYLNLNGGDSWGYYYPKKNPEILYNFKDEDNYRLKDICPEHYAEALKQAEQCRRVQAQDMSEAEQEAASIPPDNPPPTTRKPRKKKWGGLAEEKDTVPDSDDPDVVGGDNVIPFVFIDRETGTYWRGWYNEATGDKKYWNSPNLHVQRNFQLNWGMDTKAPYEEWDILFDPTDFARFDPKRRRLNLYNPPELVRQWRLMPKEERRKRQLKDLPEIARKVIMHVVGNDLQAYKYFINWIAFVVQECRKTTTAIICQGTYGTGKDVMYQHILVPLIGKDYTPKMSMDAAANDPFNAHIEQGILALFNEADLDSLLKHMKRKTNKIMKEMISDEDLNVRKMFKGHFKKPSYLNVLLFANEKHSAHIPQGDRRYSVMPRQERPIELSGEEIGQLQEELSEIAQFFMCFDYDEAVARTPLDNESRRFIQSLSLDSNEEVFEAIRQGDFNFFVDSWPEHPLSALAVENATNRVDLVSYKDAMLEIYENRHSHRISRTAIESLVWHLTGNVQATPNKGKKWCHHNNLPIQSLRMGDKVKKAYQLPNPWKISPEHEQVMSRSLEKADQVRFMKAQQAKASKRYKRELEEIEKAE